MSAASLKRYSRVDNFYIYQTICFQHIKQELDFEMEDFEMPHSDSESASEYETNNPESSIDSLASESEYDDGDNQGFRRLGAEGDGQSQQNPFLADKSKKRLVIKDGKIMAGAKSPRKDKGEDVKLGY